MNWNVAEAKQRLSEVIRQAAREPQVIYSRNSPVAAVIAAEELAEYRAWRERRSQPTTLAEEFDRLRDIAAGDPDPLPVADRLASMRSDPVFTGDGAGDEARGDTQANAAR